MLGIPIISQQLVATQIHPQVSDWYYRVIKNGGGAPSSKTMVAVNQFYYDLNIYSLLTKIKACNCFVPDNLIASITPLVNSGSVGNDPWTNSNFVAADLAINGLKSDTTKWLNTGINPSSTAQLNTGSNGITLMTDTATGGELGHRDAGIASATGNDDWCAYAAFSGFSIWDFGNVLTGDRISVNNAALKSQGYFSFNVTARNAQVIYRGFSAVHSTLVSGTNNVTATSPPNKTAYVFTANDGNATPGYKCSKRFSFAAFHKGFTAHESSNLYIAVRKLRKSLGGGII
jgi:hypothetical protein